MNEPLSNSLINQLVIRSIRQSDKRSRSFGGMTVERPADVAADAAAAAETPFDLAAERTRRRRYRILRLSNADGV
jgi:hypothetical protein